tara:strand:+ start:8597 stop:9025 length:429 start_codon:yes stop_codon:yes gene_type:complete
MKRLIACSLACLIAVSANANNWFYIDTTKDGVDHYMDVNTLRVVDQNAQIVTAFVKMRGIEKTKLRFNNMIVSSTSFKFAFDCRNETGRTLSSIFYDVNGTVVNSDDNHVGQFTTIHPGTSQYLNMYSACAMTGFKSIEGIL